MRCALAALLFAVASLTSLLAQAPAGWTDVQRFYRHALAQHGIAGSSLALVKDGRIVAREQAGLRDVLVERVFRPVPAASRVARVPH
jgi:CubicO group peptidase (beta-lactamase class C family)